jgi:hypothetical protein
MFIWPLISQFSLYNTSHNPIAQAAPTAPAKKVPISIAPIGILIAAAPPVLEEVVPIVGVAVSVVEAVTPDVKGGAVAEEAADVLVGFSSAEVLFGLKTLTQR